MQLGKVLLKSNKYLLEAILVSPTYQQQFQTMAKMMAIRLKEKMMISREAKMESIIKANRDMGSPHILAPLRMSL